MVRITGYKVRQHQALLFALIIIFGMCIPVAVICQEGVTAPPLLLSIDVERDSDVQALTLIDLKEPATYFVTGEFAQKFPEFVSDLAHKGTIGSHSHSHPNLTEMGVEEAREDLQNSSQAIAAATGRSPVWFRAPFLEVNEEVLRVASELGFLYDSSEPERWVQQQVLGEFPISLNDTGRVLFSDYDFFYKYGLDDSMTLAMLKENYLSRYTTGRPFVFLLHPSIIALHKETLHRFIDFVKKQGGRCLSFDQYLSDIVAEKREKSVGVRIDLSLGILDVDSTIRDLVEAQVTDVFISARDKEGRIYSGQDTAGQGTVEACFIQLVQRLKERGVRIHAWIPVLRNDRYAAAHPSLAMVDGLGQTSGNWISPSHPENIDNIITFVTELLSRYGMDGIHLDDIIYPALDYDYSQVSLKKFSLETGIAVDHKIAASVLPSKFYNEWVTWRAAQLHQLTEAIAVAVRSGDRDVIVSAALDAQSLVNFRIMERTGQDYRLLGETLDMIIVEPTSDAVTSMNRLISMGRFKVGKKTLLFGIPIFSKRSSTDNTIEEFARQLGVVRKGGDGLLLSPYRLFFEHEFVESDQRGNLHQLLTGYRQPAEPTSSQEHLTEISFVHEAQASPAAATETTPPETQKSFTLLQGTAIGGLLLFALLGVRFMRSRRFHGKPGSDGERIDLLNWQSLDKKIAENQISGQLVGAVAGHLRSSDPVSTSRNRRTLVLDLVANEAKDLRLNDLIAMTVDIPGWEILAMSHLQEAAKLGYLRIDLGRIKITDKGVTELKFMQENGFDSDHWIFVEQRLHENLMVSCPHCEEESVTHWYWSSFTCNLCNREVRLLDCTNIVRQSPPVIRLDQHYYV